jgi:hypothetical protein
MKLPKGLLPILIASFAAVYGAGTLYWLSHLYLRVKGEFGPEPHWLERVAGPVHVVAAFLFLFVVGMIWPQHVRPAMRQGKGRFSGWLMFALMTALIATGVTILYAGEAGMELAGQIHPWVGQGLLATLVFHGLWHSLKRVFARAK